ncbi:6433_t:CDS:2, partial [Ambispora leptoticha]
PNNQEVFVDANTDQSIIVEILELATEASPEEVASFHFSSVALDNDAEDSSIVQQTGILTPAEVPNLPSNTLMYFANGQQMVAKFNERDSSARNLVNIFLAVFRLPQYQTDLVITYNIPVLIGAMSSSRPIAQEGNVHVGYEEFKRILASFQIVDWNVFG